MTVFEKIIQDMELIDGAELLEECMTLNPQKTKKIPLRYRLIAMGFVTQMSLDALNAKLEDNGCEQLYARNFLEASLIFAFSSGMRYEDWMKLYKKYAALLEQNREGTYFNDGAVTYRELRQYVLDKSDKVDDMLVTQHQTQHMKKQLMNVQGNEEEFCKFLEHNLKEFSCVREKARYYFCKYLHFYIEERIERYFYAKKTGFGKKHAASDLFVLKCAKELRKGYSDDELREKLLDSRISFGNVYGVFASHYFEYVSVEWIEALLEYYDGLDKLSKEEQKSLARSIRKYHKKWEKENDSVVIQKMFDEMEAKEEELDAIHSSKNKGRGYQKGRAGEKSVRSYIQGTVDIDRTSLICYLLFLGSSFSGNPEQAITCERLNHILFECGFTLLRKSDDFDLFVSEYLVSDNPQDYLIQAVTQYALKEQNFFLYHMYRNSFSNEEKNQSIMVKEKSK